jgi:adenylate cyclase
LRADQTNRSVMPVGGRVMLQGQDVTKSGESKPYFRARRVASGLLIAAIALATSAAIAGSIVTLSRNRLLPASAPDRATYDWRTALFSRTEPHTRHDIVLLIISDRTLSQYPYQLPTDRGLLAEIVRALNSAGAKAIGLDVIFDRQTDKDERLIEAIRNSRVPIVLGEIDRRLNGLDRANLQFQRDFFARAGNPLTGHLYLLNQQQSGLGQPDPVVRYLPKHLEGFDRIQVSFAEALVKASGRDLRDTEGPIAWLKARADDGAETFDAVEIPSHPPESLTADTVVALGASDRFKDKIVLVGGNYEDRDQHPTPMTVIDGAQLPGVKIHAQILAQLLDERSITELSVAQELAAAFLLALFGFVGGRAFRFNDYQFLIYVLGAGFLVGIGVWLFSSYRIVLPSETSFFSLIVGIFAGHYSQKITRRLRSI